jgi:tetratricopeptide (TPR) repeat protein
MGEDLKAVEELQKIILKDTLTTKHVTAVKEVYNKSGIKGLLSWLIELELKNPKPSSLNLAKWYTMLDKRKEAIDWLEKALEQNLPNTLRINNNPDYDTLRSEPGFVALIEKMGLSAYGNGD